jgi:hypothetical protein
MGASPLQPTIHPSCVRDSWLSHPSYTPSSTLCMPHPASPPMLSTASPSFNDSSLSIPLGIIFGLLASFIQSLGLTIQRKSHILNQGLPSSQQRLEYRRPFVNLTHTSNGRPLTSATTIDYGCWDLRPLYLQILLDPSSRLSRFR